jgi:hypothetical protein
MKDPASQDTEICLRAWSSVWFLYVLCPETGKFSRKKILDPNNDHTPINGHASIEPVLSWSSLFRCFYAVYAFDDRLYFQAGIKRWDITDVDVDTRYWCRFGLASGFRLILNGKTVHRVILFHPNRAMWPFIDPTYDGIDFDSDHFLYFLSVHLTDDEWKQRLLSMA